MKMKKIKNYIPLNLMFFLILSSCMGNIAPKEDKSLSSQVSSENYTGCISATAISTSEINVSFDFPSKASEVQVHRNGLLVSTFSTPTVSTFTDDGLEEGKTYKYTCIAKFDDKFSKGLNEPSETTIAVNSPVFAGISTATPISSTSVQLTWPPATGGAVVSYFQIFVTRGSATDFTTARTTVAAGTYSLILSNLADELQYTFSVRACNASDICDTNTVVKNLTNTDKGIPTSLGTTGVSLVNGKARINTPWIEEYGGVKKRNVYRSTTNTTISILANKILSVLTADINNPEQYVEDSTILEGNTYYYIVRDEDPTGNENTNSVVQSLSIGDLSPPNAFAGLTSVTSVAPFETTARLTFNTISHQPGDSNGASYYLVYQTEADHPASPSDSCTSGTLAYTLNASSFTPSSAGETYDITGLSSRKKYSFCMKAQDAALNISNTTISRSITMPDQTAPTFDGIQGISYDSGTDYFTISWNAMTSVLNDQSYYKASIWKNTTTPTAGQISTKIYNYGTNTTSATFTKTDFTYVDGDTVYVVVDACDDANTGGGNFNGADNCTAKALSTYKFKNLVDTTPPPLWGGVINAINISENLLQVSWNLPADKTDYNSFKIYHIEETSAGNYSKIFLDQTTCISSDCVNNPKTSHFVAINRPYHTFNIFVAALDANANETNATTPNNSLSTFQVRSADTTPPSFNSSLSATPNGGTGRIELDWSNATDNQYMQDTYTAPNVIKYSVYKKEGITTFEAGDYDGNGVPIIGGTITRIGHDLPTSDHFELLSSLLEGQTYHYTVCAYDMTLNTSCDQIQTIVINDNTPPIIAVSTDGLTNTASWDLDILVSDGPKDPTGITVKVWRKFSDSPTDFPPASGTQLGTVKNGTGTIATPTEFVFATDYDTNDGSGTNHFANYTVQATDASENIATTTFSHLIRGSAFGVGSPETVNVQCSEDIVCEVDFDEAGSVYRTLNAGRGLDKNTNGTTIYIQTAPAHGTISHCYGLNGTALTDTECRYTQTTAHFNGVDSYVMCAKDNIYERLPGQFRSCRTVNVNIAAVNDPPELIANTHTLTYNNNSSFTLDLMNGLLDHDGTGETFTITSASFATPGMPSIDCSAGSSCSFDAKDDWQETHEVYFKQIHQINYTVSDGTNSSIQTSFLKMFTYHSWTGLGGNNLWSNKDNWCGTLSGEISGSCQGASSSPNGSSIVAFSDYMCSANCTSISLDEFFTSASKGLFLTDGFTGTITANSLGGLSLTYFSGGCTTYATNIYRLNIAGGTLDLTSALSTTINGITLLSGGTVLAPSYLKIGTTRASCYQGDLHLNGTFTHNNGTIELVMTNTTLAPSDTYKNTLKTNGNNLYNLIINADNEDSFYDVEASTTVIVENDFTLKSGRLEVKNTGTFQVGGNVDLQYTDTTHYAKGLSETLITMIGANKTIKTNALNPSTEFPSLIIDAPGASISSFGDSNLSLGLLYIKEGTFTAPSGTLKISNNSSFDYDDSTDLNDDIRGLRVSNIGNFVHNSGTLDLTTYGNPGANYNGQPALVVYLENQVNLHKLVVNQYDTNPDSAISFDGTSYLMVNDELTINAGSLYKGKIQTKGAITTTCTNITLSCPLGGSTVLELTNVAGQTVTLADNSRLPILEINNGQTVTLSYSTTNTNVGITGLHITDGGFNAPSGTLYLGPTGKQYYTTGRFTAFKRSSGTIFNHNNGLIYIHSKNHGGSGQVDIESSITTEFYDLKINVYDDTRSSWSSTLNIDPFSSFVVINHLTVEGERLSGGQIDLKGDFTFSLNSEQNKNIRSLTTDLNFIGTGTQNIYRTAGDGSTYATTTFKTDIIVNKPSGTLEFQGDFSEGSFNSIDVKDGNSVNLNSNNVTFDSVNTNSTGVINP